MKKAIVLLLFLGGTAGDGDDRKGDGDGGEQSRRLFVLKVVGVPGFEPGSRANPALTDYKSAALPLSYTPAETRRSAGYSMLEMVLKIAHGLTLTASALMTQGLVEIARPLGGK